MNSDPLANTTEHSIGKALVTGSGREDIVVQALQDCQAAIDAGKEIDRAAMLAKYPDIREELSACLDGLELMRRPPSDDSGPLAERSAHSPISPLATLGDFRIVREIGRGGMGLVYEAEQLSIGRSVALKVLPYAAMLDKRQIARFQNEARAAATLEHPHIVPVYFVGNERGVYYYAMRLIDGKNLAEVMGELCGNDVERPPLSQIASQLTGVSDCRPAAPPNQQAADAETVRADAEATKIATDHGTNVNVYYESIARLGNQAASALDFAHGHGIIHRDIKPANIMLDEVGDAWITDFGLARIESDGGMTMTGDLIGTLRYMSPEQTLAKRITVDHRSDVYSLGATLYELLTLRPLFDGDDRASLLKKIAFDEPTAPSKIVPTIPRDLETIILKSLQKNPDDRYATAQEFADDLQRFLAHEPVKARRTPWAQRIRMWTRRHPALAASAAIVCTVSLISAAAFGLLVAKHERDARTQQESATAKIEQALQDREEALEDATANLQLANDERERAEANLLLAVQAVEETYLNSIGEDRLLRIGVRDEFASSKEKPTFTDDERKIVERGLAFYDQIARQNPSSPRLRFESAKAFSRLALLHGGLDENAEASAAYEQAIARLSDLVEHAPAETPYLAELARAYYQQARLSSWWPDAKDTFDEAITAANRVLDVSPNDVDALQLRARSYVCQQKYERATTDFEKIVTLRQDDAAACYELSQTLDDFGQTQPALVYAKRSVELSPNTETYRTSLAYIYRYRLDDPDSAAAVLEPLLQVTNDPMKKLEIRFQISHFRGEHQQTVDLTSQWIEQGGDSLRAYRWRAKAHSALQNNELAISDLGKCMERATTANEFQDIGRQYEALGRSDQALLAWEQAEKLNPNNHLLYRERGLSLLRRGNDRESLKDLKRLLHLVPNGELYAELAVSLAAPDVGLGKFESAAGAWLEFAEQNPIECQIFRESGFASFERGKHRESLQAFEIFFDRVPNPKKYSYIYKRMAISHFRLGEYDAAVRCIATCMDLDPKDTSTLGWIYNEYKPERVDPAEFREPFHALMKREIDRFTKLIQEGQQDSVYWQNRATAKRVLGQFDEAIADYLKVLELEPENAYCWCLIARTYEGATQNEKALDAYAKAIELDPKPAQRVAYLNRRAKLHAKMGNRENALADYTRASVESRNPVASWFYRALLNSELGKTKEAVEAYTRVIELDAQQAGAWMNRGNMHQRLGQFEDAVRDASQVIEMTPEDPGGWHNRAHAFASLGDYDRAMQDFTKAIELGHETVVFCRASLLGLLERHDEAIADWRNVLKLRKERQKKLGASLDANLAVADAYRGLAFALQSAAQIDEALETLQDAARLCQEWATASPKDATYWAMLGRSHGDVANLKAYHQASETHADCELAIFAFEKSLELNRNPNYLSNLAGILVDCPEPKLRDPERSLNLVTEVLELAEGRAPRSFEQGQWLTLGIAHYRLGNWQESIEALAKSVPAKGLNFIAMCHWQLGDKELAAAKFDEGVIAHQKAILNDHWTHDDENETRRYRHEAKELVGTSEGTE